MTDKKTNDLKPMFANSLPTPWKLRKIVTYESSIEKKSQFQIVSANGEIFEPNEQDLLLMIECVNVVKKNLDTIEKLVNEINKPKTSYSITNTAAETITLINK